MQQIPNLRKEIDKIDDQIILLLKERVQLSKRIGKMKKDQNLPLRDPQREEEVYATVRKKASKLDLDPQHIVTVYHEIIAICLHVQQS